jgi:hypothetical protein
VVVNLTHEQSLLGKVSVVIIPYPCEDLGMAVDDAASTEVAVGQEGRTVDVLPTAPNGDDDQATACTPTLWVSAGHC